VALSLFLLPCRRLLVTDVRFRLWCWREVGFPLAVDSLEAQTLLGWGRRPSLLCTLLDAWRTVQFRNEGMSGGGWCRMLYWCIGSGMGQAPACHPDSLSRKKWRSWRTSLSAHLLSAGLIRPWRYGWLWRCHLISRARASASSCSHLAKFSRRYWSVCWVITCLRRERERNMYLITFNLCDERERERERANSQLCV
jgi:hypothetical protein